MATKKQSVVRRSGRGKKLTARQQQQFERVSNILSSLPGTLASRLRFLSRAGFQYGGKRDIFAVAGYVKDAELSFEHYWGLYTRGDVAGRIVDMPAKTTWRKPPDVYEEDRPDGTDFTQAFSTLAKRIKLWRYLERVDRLSGVGQYAVLLLGVRGVDDTQLKKPLGQLAGPDSLIYLSVFTEANAAIAQWVKDTGDPRFGQPLLYNINLSSGISGFPTATVPVHWSRIIHVAEDALQDEVYGRPRLQRPLNRLYDLDKIAASVGESFWQAAARILQAKIDPDAAIDPADLQELDDKLSQLTHDLRRQFYGQGMELGWLPATAEDPKSIPNLYFELIAAATGIPRRILFGNEEGSLASSTDQATYFGMIDERQEHHAEPLILRAFIDRLVGARALPQPSTGEYEVDWPSLFQLTEGEQADANYKRAQAVAALTPQGGDPMTLAEIDEDRNIWPVPRDPTPQVPLDQLTTINPDGTEAGLPPGGAGGAEGDQVDAAGQPTSTTNPNNPGTIPTGVMPQAASLAVNAMTVQTLIFPKRLWQSAAQVRAWATQHSFTVDGFDQSSQSWRLRQRAPSDFVAGSLRTICLTPANTNPGDRACRIKAVVGRPKGGA